MTSLYLADVAGDGSSLATAFRPSGFDGKTFSVLMIDQVQQKAIIYSPDDSITGAGITNFLSAGSRPALITLAQSTSPTAGQRNAIVTWCTNAGYTVPSVVGNPTWWTVLHYIAHQVNGAADLATTTA